LPSTGDSTASNYVDWEESRDDHPDTSPAARHILVRSRPLIDEIDDSTTTPRPRSAGPPTPVHGPAVPPPPLLDPAAFGQCAGLLELSAAAGSVVSARDAPPRPSPVCKGSPESSAKSGAKGVIKGLAG